MKDLVSNGVHASRLYVVTSLLGLSLVGAGWLRLESVSLALLGAGLCAALGRRGWTALGCGLAAAAFASSGVEVGPAPDPTRPVEIVVQARSHWRPSGDGFVLAAVAEHYRQSGPGGRRTVVWRVPLTLTIDRGAVGGEPPHAGRVRVKGYVRRAPPLENFGVGPRSRRYRLSVQHLGLLSVAEEASLVDRFWGLSTAVRCWVRSGFLHAGESGTDPAVGSGDEDAPSVARSLFEALVLGETGELPVSWTPALRRTGTVHVLAVSGLHVGLLLLLVLRLGGGASPGLRALAGWAALGTYLVLVGPRPSLVRAAVMGGGGLLSLVAERPRAVGAALEWALLLLVACDPPIVRDFGFQLTASATFSILWASRRFATLDRRSAQERSPGSRWLGRIGVGVAAQLGTLPFLLPRTGLTAVWGPCANLIAVPWAAATLAASWIWLLLGLERNPFGRAWGSVVAACAWVPSALSVLPSSRFAARIGFPIALFGCVLAIVLAGLVWRRRSKEEGSDVPWVGRSIALVVLLTLSAPAMFSAGLPSSFSDVFSAVLQTVRPLDVQPEVIFLDVGQGDATLIRDGEEALLIDGGGWLYGDIASSVLVPALAGLGVSHAPAIAVTHSDRDHCKGLLELSTLVPIEAIWVASGWPAGKCTRKLALRSGIPVKIGWRGQKMTVGRWNLEVLWPPAGTERTENETSLVLLAEVDGRRVLLPGDIDEAAERKIIDRANGVGDDPRAVLLVDLVKLAHHGSKTSTSEAWLDATRPRLAVASAGRDNSYRHPAQVVVERLERRGVRVLRTDLVGAVRVRFPEGRALQVISAVPASEFD